MAQEVNADGTPAPLAFVPAVGTKDCTDLMAWGVPSVLYSYIFIYLIEVIVSFTLSICRICPHRLGLGNLSSVVITLCVRM